MNDLVLNAVLTADGSQFVGEVKASEQQLQRLTGTQATATRAAAGATEQAARLAQATRGGTRQFQRFGGVIQQAGFQVGDFAVQVASGQGALRAFTQQGSQMLQVFGPMGAVLGAGVAIAGALATAMFQAGDAMDSAADDAEKFADTLDRIKDFRAQLNGAVELSRKDLEATLREEREKVLREIASAKDDLENEQQRLQRERERLAGITDVPESKFAIALREELDALAGKLVEVDHGLGRFEGRLQGSARNAKEALALVAREEEKAARSAERAAEQAEREAGRRKVATRLINGQSAALRQLERQEDRLAETKRKLIAGLEDEAEAAQLRLRLAGADQRTREVELGLLKQIQAARAADIALTREEIAERKRLIETVVDADAVEAEARRAAEAMQEPFKNALSGVQGVISDTFEDAFSGSIDSAADAAEAMKRIFVRLGAELATMLVLKPVVGGPLRATRVSDLFGEP